MTRQSRWYMNCSDLALITRCYSCCSNNTIEGTQFQEFPNTGKVPLVADMSSDIASRRLDFKKFSLIYASIYNAVSLEDVQKTVDFMAKFRKSA